MTKASLWGPGLVRQPATHDLAEAAIHMVISARQPPPPGRT